MKEKIKLISRDNTNNYLTRFKDTTDAYILKTEYCIRMGGKGNNLLFIDPSGGPMLSVGKYLTEANAIILNIFRIKNIGFVIILKEHDLSCNKTAISI